MAINKDEIDKYIFDPNNPKQCKSYKLLLKLAKDNATVYVGKDYVYHAFKDIIVTSRFEESLWDKPENFDSFTVTSKIDTYIKNHSKKEFQDYINTLETSEKYFKYNKIFKQFFIAIGSYICKPKKYSTRRLEEKIKDIPDFTGCELYKNRHDVNNRYSGNKILFSNDIEILKLFPNIFDVASIFVTVRHDLFINEDINPNIKPLFLKRIEDVDILLDTLEKDLKQSIDSSGIEKQDIKDLEEIQIKNFFSIKEINLNLKDKKEIYIVGANGDGKTLLLQAIVVGLKGTLEDGLKEFRARESEFKIEVAYKEDIQNSFFAYGASRNNVCQLKEDSTGYLTLFSGEYDLKSPKDWLISLYNAQNAKEHTIVSLEDAITLLQKMLERDIAIEVTYNNIIFKEKGSEVSFEQLSAGYRGVIIIICDLIERLSKKQQVEKIKDFKGVVLIDEVELHLHPKWQYGFMTKLRETFPLIQFIVTTHSPTVLLGAGMEAVYYEIYKEDGVVKISDQKEVENNFLNDIQTDIFGFDVNEERINNPSMDDKKRQQKAKEALLSLIETIGEEQ